MYNMNDLILYGSIVLLGAVISFLCWQIFNFIDSVPMKIVIILINLPLSFYLMDTN